MITVYLDYPTSRISIHEDRDCVWVHKALTGPTRRVRLTEDTLPEQLAAFRDRQHRFRGTAQQSSLWLDIDLGDRELERDIIRYVQRLLARHYTPFAKATISTHC